MHEQQPGEERGDELLLDEGLSGPLEKAMAISKPAKPPRIWIGSVEDYLAGEPFGRWTSAARHPDDLADTVYDMRTQSPTAQRSGTLPRWGVFAAEGFGQHAPPPGAPLSEIAELAFAIRAESRAFAAWAGLSEGDYAHALRFRQVYQGRFDDLADWLNLQVERAGWDRLLDSRLPAGIRPFVEINLDALGHDLQASGEVAAVRDPALGGVWVFANRQSGETQASLPSLSAEAL